MKEGPNVLFILVDALRAKNLGCYGYLKQTSPNIDNLAKEAVLFEDAYSCATTTHPSLTSIFSGTYPLSHGILRHNLTAVPQDIQALNESGTVFLPEILKSEDYVTFAIDWLGRWHKRGYDYYSGVLSPHKLKFYSVLKLLARSKKLAAFVTHTKLIDDAKIVTNKAINLLKKCRKRRFFLFVHYWDTHIPYNPPKHYVEQFLKDNCGTSKSIKEIFSEFDPEHLKLYFEDSYRIPSNVKDTDELLARYDGATAYVDNQLRRLLETLNDSGISDETLIILTSDHGESLIEHGIYFGHHGLYDTTIHVPLILKYSGLPSRQRIKGFIQHIDIVPSILDILGIKTKSSAIDGKSVIPLINGQVKQLRDAVYVEEADVERKKAIRTADYKYIYALSEKDAMCKACGRIHGGTRELYDLNKDPGETENIVEENPDAANKLQEKLSEWVKFVEVNHQKCLVGKKKSYDTSLEEEEIITERLKALGYF